MPKLVRNLAVLASLLLIIPAFGAAFTPGNIVVYRVGTGAAALTNASTAVFLDEYTPAGVLAQSVPLPTAVAGAQRRLTSSGTSVEGFLNLSTDGRYVLLTGYDSNTGVASIAGTTAATANRVVGRVAYDGTIDTSTAFTADFSAVSPRSAVSTTGTDLWVVGAGSGVRHITLGTAGASTAVSTTVTNLRTVNITDNQLYISTASGAANRIMTVGSGTPTTAGHTATPFPGMPIVGPPAIPVSPYGFFLANLDVNPGPDTVYLADDSSVVNGGGIQKWSLVSGTWTHNGTIPLTGNTARAITGRVVGTTVTLYATNPTTIQTITDTSGHNGAFSGSPTTIATAGANTNFRGIAPAPTAGGDVTPPAITADTVPADGTYVAGQALTFTVTYDEVVLVAGGTPSLAVTLDTGGTVQATNTGGSGTNTLTFAYTVVSGNNDPTGIAVANAITLNGATIKDAAGNNASTTPSFASTAAVLVDAVAPTVQSIVRTNPNPTNAGSVAFTVTFTEPVTGTGTYGIATTGSLAGTSVTNVTGTGATRTVTVNTGTGSGDLRLDFIDDDTVADGVGQNTSASCSAGESYSIDRTAPAVLTLNRANPNPTSAATVDFTVTFSEPVTGVDISDFNLVTTVIPDATVNPVITGSGAGPYTITVNTGNGSGTIGLDFVSNGTVIDAVSNPTTANFTGQVYTVDKSFPTVSSINRADTNPSNASDVDFTVLFSTAVTGVDSTDFALALTGPGASINTVASSDGGLTWNVNVNSVTGDGTLGLNLIDNDSITAISNSAQLGGNGPGNGNFTGQVYNIDHTPPAVQSLVRANTNPTNATSVDFTVTFTESVTGVNAADFIVNSGPAGSTISGVSGTGTTWTVSVNTGSGDASLDVDFIDDDSVADTAGNTTPGGFTGGEIYTIDKTAPTVSSINRAAASPTNAASVDFTVTFSETVTGVGTADFTLATSGIAGASIAGISGSGPYTVTVNTGSGTGTIGLNLADDDSIADTATNKLGGTGIGNGNFTGQVYTIERAPAAPTGLAATPGNNTVGLTWVASAGATTYNVKRSTVNGGPYTTIASPATAAHNDNTAANGTTYYYVVSAVNAFGESPDSAQVSATPALPANAIGVVISQLFGGNGGAYNQDYVELFNPTAGTVSIAGYALQYGSATGLFGSVATNIYTFPGGTTIGAGRYLTVAFGALSGTGAPVTSDINVPTGLNMSGASGKVAFTINGTALGCGATATPCALPHANIVDVVAYGAANNGEGGTSVKNGVALATSEGGLRKFAGCQDTGNNNNDFDVATTGTGLVPRTAATPQNVCGPVNLAPTINTIANPYTTVNENAAPFAVNLTGNDDGGLYTWSATPGAGVSNVAVSGGQGTANVTYTVTLQTNFYGTATFTAFLSDGVHPSVSKVVNISVTRDLSINHVPTITPPANPYTSVIVNSAPQNVNLTGNDDNNSYNWSATPGTGVTAVIVTAGQGTANVTYQVTIQPAFIGTATFTASLSDGVNPPTNQTVNIGVTPTGSTVNHLVISQLYGAGGNALATWSHDYIEIYNPTGNPVNLTGWTLQYSSATNTGNFSGITPLGGTIGAGEYFLVQLASNDTSVGAPLVAPTLTGDINLSGSNGKVALVNDSNPVGGTCGTLLTDPNIVDFIGYGSTANCSEGNNNAPQPTNNQSALFRASNGDVDTNNNGNDFSNGAANPHPHVPPVEVGPFVVSTDPSSGDNNAPRDANLVIIFNESVDVTGSWYDITCVTSGNHNSATVSRSGTRSWTIVPNVNFIPTEQCTATLFASQIVDSDTDDSAPGTNVLGANYVWSFTISTGTAPAYPPSVHETFGNPSDAVNNLNVPDNYLMVKPELTLSYNRSRNTPNWVSWHLADEWIGTLTRVDTFRADPAIDPTWYRVLGSDYSGSGFDRGHMVPNADRDKETSSPINQATFLMTNIIPQAPDNNQGPWANMENYLRTLLPANELYIVAGGAGTGGTGSNGFTNTITTFNGATITVPAQTWKVVLIQPKASGDDVARVTAQTCTVAVLMPNTQGIRTNPNDPNDWMSYITTVDAIEQLTGYDFFENVPDAIEAAIEGGTNCTNKPGAANKTSTVAEDGSTGITLEGVSPTNAPLTYIIVTNPANGQLTGTGANRTYTPNLDYNGSDSFTYKVNDGQDSNTATVSITITEVNDAPSAANDAKSASANTPLNFPASDLTVNDSKGPANESTQTLTVTAVAVTGSTNGTVALAGGTVTYTPNPGFSGAASFTYTVCDNGTTAGASASLCASGTVNVTVAAPVTTNLLVTMPANVTAGTPFNVTVTARDAANGTVTTYAGTIAFTSSSAGTLPANYTFVAGDNGVHTFSVTLTSTGAQSLTATDTSTPSITGTGNTTVGAAPLVATNLLVAMPANVTAGTPFNVTVTARDASNATVTTYSGSIAFSSSSAGTLPANYTFVAGDNGVHTFSVTLTSTGAQSLTATDTTTPSITGTGNTTVGAAPLVATNLLVAMPANVTAGTPFNVTVTARDASNATVTTYTGTIAFSSSSAGTLPPNYTYVGGDNGVHTFSVTLTSTGARSLTATDTTTPSITGTGNTTVGAAPLVATNLLVVMPATVTAGTPFNVTVTARDASNATVTTYTGTIAFSSSSAGTLPANYTFVAGDNGTHTFSVTFTSTGSQSLTATDTVNPTITGTANTTVPAPIPQATNFLITAPGSVTVGVPFNITVTARTATNSTATTYTGTVHFTSTGTAILPADYTFVPGDGGIHVFTVTIPSTGTRTITATDTVSPSITGNVTLTPVCGPAPTAPVVITASGGSCGSGTGAASVASDPLLAGATYQWTLTNGTITSGQGGPSITFSTGSSGSVSLNVTTTLASGCPGPGGSSQLAIQPAPRATIPTQLFVCQGVNRTIPVQLSGAPPFTIVWSDGFRQTGINDLQTTRTLSFQSNRSLRITSVSDANCTSTAGSNTMSVFVSTIPVITVHPQSIKLKTGEKTVITVTLQGAGFGIQWFEGVAGDESKPVGDGLAELPFGPRPPGVYRYWVKATNGCGSAISDVAVVTVETPATIRRRAITP